MVQFKLISINLGHDLVQTLRFLNVGFTLLGGFNHDRMCSFRNDEIDGRNKLGDEWPETSVLRTNEDGPFAGLALLLVVVNLLWVLVAHEVLANLQCKNIPVRGGDGLLQEVLKLLLELKRKFTLDYFLKFFIDIVHVKLTLEEVWHGHPANRTSSRVGEMLPNALDTKSVTAW